MPDTNSPLDNNQTHSKGAEGPLGQVLLLEDDAVLRRALRNVLALQNYRVLEAETRVQALDCFEQHEDIAIVIADLGLPPMPHTTEEGLQAIREIATNHPSVKIVVLTGQSEEQAAMEAIREGAFDFLSKPASSQDILNSIGRAELFHRKERDLAAGGVTRVQFSARVADGLKAAREEAEEKLIRQVLKETGFNVYQSAARLGVKRESIYYFMKKFSIRRDDH